MSIKTYPPVGILGSQRISNSLWLVVKPKIVSTVNFNARKGSVSSSFIKNEPILRFLMPDEFSYSLSHRWQESTTISGELRELLSKGIKEYGLLEGEGSNIINQASKLNIKEGLGGAKTVIKGIISGGSTNVDKFAIKNDNPVVYENSSRRSLNIEVNLSIYSNPYEDVYEPIELFEKWSSPKKKDNSILEFEWPYIFDVSIVLGDSDNILYSIQNAAITNMAPTLKAPYINGYPSSAELTITFEEIDPLYSSNKIKGTVTTS